MARAHRVSGLGRTRGLGRSLGQDDGSGDISALDASLISQGITTAGALTAQALRPVPTVSYNPSTGLYMASGGAALPTGQILGSSLDTTITSLLPLLLLAGGAVLVLSMARR